MWFLLLGVPSVILCFMHFYSGTDGHWHVYTRPWTYKKMRRYINGGWEFREMTCEEHEEDEGWP
jgi:hypothetical protein